MREKNFPFLKPEIEGRQIGEGSFVKVYALANLPESIRKKVPDGHIIKEYKSAFVDAFQIAKMYKQRQELVQNFFYELPELVLEGQFIVGQTTYSTYGTVYEIQKFIDASLDFREIGKVIELITPAEREKILSDLKKILSAYEKASSSPQMFPEGVPDLAKGNLLYDRERNEWKLIDTNHLESPTKFFADQGVEELKKVLEIILK